MPASHLLRAWWARRPPAAGAAVTATGAVALACDLAGREVLSRILLVLAGAAWLGLAADLAVRFPPGRRDRSAGAGSPAAPTAVAATTVVGTGVCALGWLWLGEALLALAVVLWPALLAAAAPGWRRGVPGSVFLGCVATQGLAVLGATLARAEGAPWLGYVSLAVFWAGLALYCLALLCFDPREVARGAGDQWIAGGALAFSALAGSGLLAADDALSLWNDDDRGVLHRVTVGLLVLGLCWYAVLLVAEVARPRLRYDVRRWSTVFPMGMTAAAVLSVAGVVGVPGLRDPGRALLWVAVAAWCVVAAGALGAVRSAGGAAGSAGAGGFRSTAPR
ncbi:hypothetical protein ACL02U_00695 [Streptomyces sp. MS06]|uniref:SLAC1 family transporter n=1 Tax=Streptomyces sp. MS06 TaxID=3385974 RepID=UPI00399F13EC